MHSSVMRKAAVIAALGLTFSGLNPVVAQAMDSDSAYAYSRLTQSNSDDLDAETTDSSSALEVGSDEAAQVPVLEDNSLHDGFTEGETDVEGIVDSSMPSADQVASDGIGSNVPSDDVSADEVDAASAQSLSEDDVLEPEATGEWSKEAGLTFWVENGTHAVGERQIAGKWYYFDPNADGAMVSSRFVYIADATLPSGGKWIYLGADGTRLTGEQYIDGGWYYLNHDTGAVTYGFVYLQDPNAPGGSKWVWYGPEMGDGRMRYGEQYIDGGWYYLDPALGAVTYGFVYLQDSNAPGGAKWVWYGPFMGDGRMRYGEQYIDGGWYYLNPYIGAVTYGWVTIPDGMGGTKTVWYGPYMGDGRMRYGEVKVDGVWQYFDTVTGRVLSAEEKGQRIVSVARSWLGTPDSYTWRFQNEVRDNGGNYCPYGPCMSFVWHVFRQAGLSGHLADGLISGFPHQYLDWFRARGKADRNPTPGSVYFLYHGGWSANLSAGHSEIVIGRNGNYVYTIGADTGGIIIRTLPITGLVSFGHPF